MWSQKFSAGVTKLLPHDEIWRFDGIALSYQLSVTTTLQIKGWWESDINVWLRFMCSQKWNEQPRYFQNRIIMFCLPVVLISRYHMPSLKRVSTELIMLVVFGRAARTRLFRVTYTQNGGAGPSPSPHLYKVAFSVRFTIYVQRK